MRDLSRESGMSLAGLYYYFESKERLLYLIQKHTFTTIVQRLKARLEGVTDPEERIRIFILNHLEYFLANQAAMKVLSHEARGAQERLRLGSGGHQAGVLPDLRGPARRLEGRSRPAVFHAHCRAEPVWHDELDLHLAQSARRRGRSIDCAGDGRHVFCEA